jgi:hypothetical protein
MDGSEFVRNLEAESSVPDCVGWYACVSLGYPQRFPLNFSPYITFLGHIINSVSPTFSSPAVVSPKYSPYIPLQYKISFSIPTFHLLSIFLLLLIEGGPTGTVVGGRARARCSWGEREESRAVECAIARCAAGNSACAVAGMQASARRSVRRCGQS